jgi:hypothetical protein
MGLQTRLLEERMVEREKFREGFSELAIHYYRTTYLDFRGMFRLVLEQTEVLISIADDCFSELELDPLCEHCLKSGCELTRIGTLDEGYLSLCDDCLGTHREGQEPERVCPCGSGRHPNEEIDPDTGEVSYECEACTTRGKKQPLAS